MKPRMQLKQIRRQKGLKQKEVAEAVGITTSYYGMIEQGVRTPTLEVAIKIANFFGVPVEEIFFDNTNNSLLDDVQTA